MLKSYFQRLFADPNGTASLVRRLLLEQAQAQLAFSQAQLQYCEIKSPAAANSF